MLKRMNSISLIRYIQLFKITLLLRNILIVMSIIYFCLLFIIKLDNLIVFLFLISIFVHEILFYFINNITLFKLGNLEFDFISDTYEEIQVEKHIKNNFLQFTVVSRCWVYALLGQFDKSIIVLNKLKIKNKKILVSKYFIQFWIYAVTYNEEKFRQTEENFITLKNYEKYHDVVQYMNMLNCLFFTKKITDIIQLSNSKLSIISQPFYSGLNYYNQQNFEQAKECFEQIKNEREDLYYVQQAKKYLAQISNN